MERRRDPFGRVTYVPVRWTVGHGGPGGQCMECGNRDPRDHRSHARADCGPKRPIYQIRSERDDGRDSMLSGEFCSWSCAEAYHGQPIAH